jgi:hypothetical protein
MNSNFKLILGCFLFFTIPFGVAKADVIDDLAALIKSGNSKEISLYLAPSVEMTILTEEEEYSKPQAEIKLKNFFSKYPPSSVKIIHRITSNPSHRFMVLMLSSGGENFRISISLKNTSGKFLITEMRIEPKV